jgi:hypothetical protein
VSAGGRPLEPQKGKRTRQPDNTLQRPAKSCAGDTPVRSKFRPPNLRFVVPPHLSPSDHFRPSLLRCISTPTFQFDRRGRGSALTSSPKGRERSDVSGGSRNTGSWESTPFLRARPKEGLMGSGSALSACLCGSARRQAISAVKNLGSVADPLRLNVHLLLSTSRILGPDPLPGC